MEDNNRQQEVSRALQAALNRHGYGFQYGVLREAERVADEFDRRGRARWVFEALEFPVGQNSGTRLDFILRHTDLPLYMLAECKRVDPALADWCFVKSPRPLSRRSPASSSLAGAVFVEAAFRNEVEVLADHMILNHSYDIYHHGFEVKTGEKGDGTGGGRDAIEGAITQVCRGLNGTLSFFRNNPQVFKDKDRVGFLPVIFTTARLWVSDVDLGSANLLDGKLGMMGKGVESRPFLFYHYPQSPGLKHMVRSRDERSSELGDILYTEYVRTIAIVSASGIADFLECSLDV